MKVLRYLKAHLAVVGAVGVWYLATYPTGGEAKWVSLGVAALTYLGVAVVPNVQSEVDTVLDHTFPDPAARADAGYTAIELLIGLIVFLVLVIFVLVPLVHHLH